MNYSANFIDKYSAQTAQAVFQEGEIKELSTYLLKEFRLEIFENHEKNNLHENHIHKYMSNKTMIMKLLEAGVEDITDIIIYNKLMPKKNIEELINSTISNITYNNVKKEICKEDSLKIIDRVLKRINRYLQWNMKECYFNDAENIYEIFIDETLKNEEAGYTVYCKTNSKNNYFSRVEGERTLQNATYQGILHVLKATPPKTPINFIIDRKVVIDVFNNYSTSHKER